MGFRTIGARVERSEDPRLLKGQGEFVDDIHLPNMLHAAFVRSNFAHARITRIDATDAKALPGVHAVFTAAELPKPCCRRLAAADVAAQSGAGGSHERNGACRQRSQFRRRSGRGRHRRQPLSRGRRGPDRGSGLRSPAAGQRLPRRGGRRRCGPAHSGHKSNKAAVLKIGCIGDVAGAFAAAAHVVHETLACHRGCAHPIECRGVLAEVNKRDGLLDGVVIDAGAPHLAKRTPCLKCSADRPTRCG